MQNHPPQELAPFLFSLRRGLWLFGTSCWLFGITDRSIATFADGYLSAIDIMQLFTALFFFFCWLFLKPSPVATTSESPIQVLPEGAAD